MTYVCINVRYSTNVYSNGFPSTQKAKIANKRGI